MSAESAGRSEGKQRGAAPSKTGSFIRGNSRATAVAKTPPLPTKKTKMQSSGGEYEGISFKALQVLSLGCTHLQGGWKGGGV